MMLYCAASNLADLPCSRYDELVRKKGVRQEVENKDVPASKI